MANNPRNEGLAERIRQLEESLAAALAEIERLQASIKQSHLETSCRGLTDGRN